MYRRKFLLQKILINLKKLILRIKKIKHAIRATQLVVNLKDFVVVRFAVGKGTERFIARVENVENGEFLGNFLRPEYAEKTKNGCFNFLDNADITNFSFCQIESIMKPKFNRRGLLYFPQDASAK